MQSTSTGKTEIIKAAIKIFARKGYAATSVDEIAAKAKVAKGTIYYHFKTKNDIFLTIIEQGIVTFVAALNKEISRADNPTEKLHAFISAQLDFFSTYHDFCRVLITEMWRLETQWQTEFQKLRNLYAPIAIDILEAGKRDGSFYSSLNVEVAATTLFNAIAFSSIEWPLLHPKDVSGVMQTQITDLLMHGIVVTGDN